MTFDESGDSSLELEAFFDLHVQSEIEMFRHYTDQLEAKGVSASEIELLKIAFAAYLGAETALNIETNGNFCEIDVEKRIPENAWVKILQGSKFIDVLSAHRRVGASIDIHRDLPRLIRKKKLGHDVM